MNYRFLCILAWAFSAAPLWAQDPTLPPLPPGPLLKRTPDYSTWIVTVEAPLNLNRPITAKGAAGEEGHEKPVILKQAAVKTGTTILEQSIDAQGQRHEIWHVSGFRIVKLPGAPSPDVSPEYGGGDIYSINFAVSDFAGLDWISAKTYSGMAKYQGRDCIAFSTSLSPLNARAQEEESIAIEQARAFGQQVPDETKVPAAAYIDLETRLPLLVTYGHEKRIYQYGAPPQEPLAIPPELADPIKQYEGKIKKLSAPAPRAF